MYSPYTRKHISGSRVYMHVMVCPFSAMISFASMTTCQLTCYNSRFLGPLTSGMDALGQTDWQHQNNFVNPPYRLLPHVLQTIRSQRAWPTCGRPVLARASVVSDITGYDRRGAYSPSQYQGVLNSLPTTRAPDEEALRQSRESPATPQSW